MIAVQDKAEAVARIANDAIAIDGDPYTLALMLAHISARVAQTSCTEKDELAYALHLVDLARRLSRGELVQ